MPVLPPAAIARLHRCSGALLGSFIAIHLVNHLLLLYSQALHRQAMDALRLAYRWPPVEALLLACVVVQVVTGVARLRRNAAAGGWTPARIAGLYLLYFLAVHTLAVLSARSLLNLDTNLYFAAAGLHVWPFAPYFVLHYLLAVVAVFVHLGSALAPRLGIRAPAARTAAMRMACAAGTAAGVAIVAAMAASQVRIPADYLAPFHAILRAV
ncbi:hypothetical protein GJ700_21400 [Duganella sp. FT92W]|uniref:Uncharacterized protein n=1 Tax=Pseudoduganella rivuli TaxID=2666085 RepID=A0A7X2LVN9_9BURK|nr:hypothetical protein [Pseudoduganella rivuli]MRV74267.1 hypothetical protein [Pseudoduganella rivuli]